MSGREKEKERERAREREREREKQGDSMGEEFNWRVKMVKEITITRADAVTKTKIEEKWMIYLIRTLSIL